VNALFNNGKSCVRQKNEGEMAEWRTGESKTSASSSVYVTPRLNYGMILQERGGGGERERERERDRERVRERKKRREKERERERDKESDWQTDGPRNLASFIVKVPIRGDA
jgi:hypothetical protein